jgi:hypothetical protein
MSSQRYAALLAALCGYPTTEYPVLARPTLHTKRRCVEFRRTRSPRDLLANLPFCQPSDGARMACRPQPSDIRSVM